MREFFLKEERKSDGNGIFTATRVVLFEETKSRGPTPCPAFLGHVYITENSIRTLDKFEIIWQQIAEDFLLNSKRLIT
jgi:hypothetical protein